jgi:drug/metabolite transporter (DMT)-like permease
LKQVDSSLLITDHVRAVFQAVWGTMLCSSPWVLIKDGLNDIPPLTFAGLRYVLASTFLIPIALFQDANRSQDRKLGLSRYLWDCSVYADG